MKRTLQKALLASLVMCTGFLSYAQRVQVDKNGDGVYNEKCITEHMFNQYAEKDPTLLQAREDLEAYTRDYIKNMDLNALERTSSGKRIIPTVFHIIHADGADNITDAQVEDQMRIMNLDFNNLTPDKSKRPAVFDALAADYELDFQLAKLDPNGNCTNGIVHVYSPLTYYARDNVKALSYWDSKKYFNVWVVRYITGGNATSIVLGFAQFPGSGSALTDGVVIRGDYCGTIGSSAGNKGRTLVHEGGHWFNLRHIWGDAQCGNDQVADTPPHYGANQSNCPKYPHIRNCPVNGQPNNGPDGEMFMNYMDYVDDACMNMFSKGQKARSDAALAGPRAQLVSATNMTATGVDGATTCTASPIAYLPGKIYSICKGGSVTFKDRSYNAPVSSYSWIFPGGTPSTSTSASPAVTYNTPGVYDVFLEVTGANGTKSKTKRSRSVIVNEPTAAKAMPFSDDFNGVDKGWSQYSEIDSTTIWTKIQSAGVDKTACYTINYSTSNTKDGLTDILYLPSLDFSKVNPDSIPDIKFKVAYCSKKSKSDSLLLTLYSSTDCGLTWLARKRLTQDELATTAVKTTAYTPASNTEYKEFTAPLLSSFAGKSQVLFRFEAKCFLPGFSNNLFLDNINIGSATFNALSPLSSRINLNLYPNPTTATSTLQFALTAPGSVKIVLTDMIGRELVQIENNALAAGNHKYSIDKHLAKGVYFVNISVGGETASQKLIVQ